MNKKNRPLNVHVAHGSPAERSFYAAAGIRVPEPQVIAPGIRPTPAHDLIFHGGKTITSLSFRNLYVGGTDAWRQTDVQSIDKALAGAMSDTGLNNVMAQYFAGKSIAGLFGSSSILSGPPPAVVSQGDVEKMLGDLFASGTLKGSDFSSTVFNFLLPSGTVLNTDQGPGSPLAEPAVRRSPFVPHDEDDSLHGLGGYHGSIHPPGPSGTPLTLYYAVGVYSETRPDGSVNGIVAFDQPWKNVVATFYHELNEARTDADVQDAITAGNDPAAEKFLGWTSRQGEECGDFPVFEANPLSLVFQEVSLADGTGTVPVQFQYSNAVHGPEGPISSAHASSVRRSR